MEAKWQDGYHQLSQLRTRDDRLAELVWRDGKLYFVQSDQEPHDRFRCIEKAVEVAQIENAPQLENALWEGTNAHAFYILSGDRTFRSCTHGESWEEI